AQMVEIEIPETEIEMVELGIVELQMAEEEMWGEMTRRYWNINLEEMMEAKVHFGHGTKKWNPRMAPYISTKRKGIHIINLTRIAQFLSSVM
ncbi:hypothetical protein G4B88_015205, partial [Cannabis sativa]